MTSVLRAAWIAAGQPRGSGQMREGSCARCGEHGPTSTTLPVSKTFTAYDEWRIPVGGTCAACGWGYSTAELRQSAHIVTRDPSVRAASRSEVCDLLSKPVPADHAVVVPLRPGRKHLVPVAQWGTVTVDDVSLGWTVDDAKRLGVVQQLRVYGFSGPTLLSPAPPFTTLRRQPKQQWGDVLRAWAVLDPWRSARRYLDLATVLTAAQSSTSSQPIGATA